MKNMKQFVLICSLLVAVSPLYRCSSDTVTPAVTLDNCGFHNGTRLYLGPQGGCYYINSSGNKTYVDRSECKC